MKIWQRDPSVEQTIEHRKEVATILGRMSEAAACGRVCTSDCDILCPTCGSTVCGCLCTANCPDMPGRMSSDPELYPLEPGIAPLSFQMKRSGVFDPCWSCEGHLHADGSFWKPPRVWFYCDSILAIRLLGDTLNALYYDKALAVLWQVRLEYSEPENPDTRFAIEPVIEAEASADLAALQADALLLSGEILAHFQSHAEAFMARTSDLDGGAFAET